MINCPIQAAMRAVSSTIRSSVDRREPLARDS